MISLDDICSETLLKNRLVGLLRKVGVPGQDEDEMIKLYENALSVSESGYRIVHKKDVDEIFVNIYNPE